MRELADETRIRQFMRALGREATAAGRVFFTGGASAVLVGWREATIDVDVKFVPDQDALLRAVPELKESLHINVELASPDDFIPVREDWAQRSPLVSQEGRLTYHHFDFTAQALAKIERGHGQDLDDVRAMFERRLIDAVGIREYFADIQPRLYRYPAIDPAAFARAVEAVLQETR